MAMNQDLLVTLTANIVSAYVAKHVMRGADLPAVIAGVHVALIGLGAQPVAEVAAEKPKPPVSIRKSVTDEFLICLEDGKKFKSLKRHLMSHFQMTPEEYRLKWSLPDDYPMVAPAYATKRSQLARFSGLGRKPAAPT